MELRQYASILLKWWWLIALGLVLAGGTAFGVSRTMTPVYQASATLMVSPGSNATTTDYNAVLTGQLLAKTYTELLKKRPVLQGAIAALNLSMTPDQLAARENVQLVRDTQLVTVQIEDADPVLAANLVNQIAKEFIETNQTSQLSRFASSKENLLNQMKLVASDMASTQADLDKARAAGNTSEVTRLETSLTQQRSSYSDLLKSYEDIRVTEAKAIDNVVVADPAEAPSKPVRPNVLMNTLLAAVVGAMLAVGVAFLVEYLDDHLHSAEDVDATLHLPLLGRTTRIHAQNPMDRLIVQKDPRSPIAEAYRSFRTNVHFSNVDKPAKAILVTSANPTEGKSTTAANLAVVMAQADLQVLLVDTDLRKPILHQIFEVSNDFGLTSAFLQEKGPMNGIVQQTKVPKLHLITSGPLPPNPSELLGSQRMRSLIGVLKEKFDVVIFDSPPVLAVTDASVLAPQADGVILVVDSERTRRGAAQLAVSNLQQIGAHFMGVALTKLSAKAAGGYYNYNNYYYYSSNGDRNRHSHNGSLVPTVSEPKNGHVKPAAPETLVKQ